MVYSTLNACQTFEGAWVNLGKKSIVRPGFGYCVGERPSAGTLRSGPAHARCRGLKAGHAVTRQSRDLIRPPLPPQTDPFLLGGDRLGHSARRWQREQPPQRSCLCSAAQRRGETPGPPQEGGAPSRGGTWEHRGRRRGSSTMPPTAWADLGLHARLCQGSRHTRLPARGTRFW